MTIRSLKPYRALKMAQKNAVGEGANIHTPGEQLGVYDQPHIYAKEELVPQIVNKTRTAIKVDRVELYYYQRKRWGIICSCWDNTERIPRQDCVICFGTGRAGGFQKFGTETILIDASLPNLVLINMLVNDTEKPSRIELVDREIEGFAEAIIDVMPNIGEIDNIVLFPNLASSNYNITISNIDNSISYPITDKNWITLLSETKIKIRITVKRLQPTDQIPYFTSLFIRYKVIDSLINSDWPRVLNSISMEDLGLPDVPQATSIVLDDTIQVVSVEDYIYNTVSREFWKIIEVTENKPLRIISGWDVQIRKVQSFEIFSDYPL